MARLPLPPAEPMKLVPLAEIARGGMGSVELARAEGGKFHGQLLAIKRLHPNIAQDPQFVGMFLDEAWMTAALKSPNVVQVAAWGNDDKGMFLAVEFVQGVSLSRLIKESQTNKEPFAERTVAYIASQICGGLSAAHALRGPDQALLGLVHRDLTPGNILVSFDGMVKIADFGIAKAEERITHTRTGTLKGKPSYMAPEQARGGKVDLRADLFSFGVLLFELLAGRKPWQAKSAFDVMMEIATQPPPELAELRKGLNPEFVQIIHKCLQKKPDERFSSAAELQQRFEAWRSSKGFTHDDQQSFAGFVVRNSIAQRKWFEEALRGEMRRAQKLTFKELEEQIDAERESAGSSNKRPGRRPSGMRPAEDQPASSPREGMMPLSGPAVPSSPRVGGLELPPSSGRASQAASPAPGPEPVLNPALRNERTARSAGNYPDPRPTPGGAYGLPPGGASAYGAGVVQTSKSGPNASGSLPLPPHQQPKSLGGTEFMAQSPFPVASSRASAVVPPPVSGVGAGTIPMPRVGETPAPPKPTVAMNASDVPNPLAKRLDGTAQPVKKKGGAGIVLLLLAVALLGGGGLAGFFFWAKIAKLLNIK